MTKNNFSRLATTRAHTNATEWWIKSIFLHSDSAEFEYFRLFVTFTHSLFLLFARYTDGVGVSGLGSGRRSKRIRDLLEIAWLRSLKNDFFFFVQIFIMGKIFERKAQRGAFVDPERCIFQSISLHSQISIQTLRNQHEINLNFILQRETSSVRLFFDYTINILQISLTPFLAEVHRYHQFGMFVGAFLLSTIAHIVLILMCKDDFNFRWYAMQVKQLSMWNFLIFQTNIQRNVCSPVWNVRDLLVFPVSCGTLKLLLAFPILFFIVLSYQMNQMFYKHEWNESWTNIQSWVAGWIFSFVLTWQCCDYNFSIVWTTSERTCIMYLQHGRYGYEFSV